MPRAIRFIPASIGAVACVLSLAGHSVAQTRGPAAGEGIRSTLSPAVPPLTIRGVGFDARDGRPEPRALVRLHDPAGNEVDGQLADEQGGFIVTAPRPGDYVLSYDARSGIQGTQRIPLTLPSDRGVALYIGFRRRASCDALMIYGSGVVPPAGPEVQAEVRDVLTGRAPSVPVLVRARQGSRADSVLIAPVDADSLRVQLFLSSVDLSEAMQVEVATTIHATWATQDVWLEPACPYHRSPVLRVWLLPRD